MSLEIWPKRCLRIRTKDRIDLLCPLDPVILPTCILEVCELVTRVQHHNYSEHFRMISFVVVPVEGFFANREGGLDCEGAFVVN